MRSKIATMAVVGPIAALIVGTTLRAEGRLVYEAPEAQATAMAGVGARISEEVDRLVEALRKAPLLRPHGSDRSRLFLVDVETGEASAIVDEPEKARAYCGSPSWSPDGRHVLFDATPLNLWQLARIESIELAEGWPKVFDLGPGRFPSVSPDGRHVAFLLYARAGRSDPPGVWLMRDDGSGRRRLGGNGRPRWSPDGRRLLIVGLGDPGELSLMDVDGGEPRPIKLAGPRIASTPAWAGPETLVATIGAGADAAVALIDVSGPGPAKIKDVLWRRRDPGPDIEPSEPVYCPATSRLAFVGAGPGGKAFYTFKKGDVSPPRRLEPNGFDPSLGDLEFSPDGRYAVFRTDNPGRARSLPRPAGPPGPAVGGPAGDVARLVAALRRDPVLRPVGSDRHRIFLMDLATGRSEPVADEPAPHLSFCGSISWSGDGRRIVFDASPVGLFQVAHIKAIDLVDGRPTLTEFNPGNCPSLSPDGRQIAYLVNTGGDATERQGVWLMRADGSDHRHLPGYGSPHWSPDGRRLLISGFSTPPDASVMDPETGQARPIKLAGRTLFLAPEWGDEQTLVAVVGGDVADTIALIDVSDPGRAKVAEILWTKSTGPAVTPSDVVFDPRSGRCIFAGAGPMGTALFAAERGTPAPARRLEPDGFDPMIADLALSPDGRYLLFRSNNPDRAPR